MSIRRIILCIAAALALASCSTTKMVADGDYRLAKVDVKVLNDPSYSTKTLSNYIKQKPATWTPMIYVYNWSSGRGTGWERLVEKIGQEPVIYDSTLVLPSVKSMLGHLEYSGHYNSSIEHNTEFKGKNAKVHYAVTLGRSYVIDRIVYTVRDTVIARLMDLDSASRTIAPGSLLSQESLENESERVSSLLKDNGYWNFTKNYFFFAADTTKVPGHCDLYVNLENFTRNESPSDAKQHVQYRLGQISVEQAKGLKLKDKLIDGMNLLESGSLYSESEIKRTYNRFTAIPVVSSVNMQMTHADSATVDCNISLKPSKLQAVKFNIEGSYNSASLFGITPAISYSHKNLLRSGATFSLGVKGNFQFKTDDNASSNEFAVSAGLIFPHFIPLSNKAFRGNVPHTDINLTYNYQDRPEYSRSIYSVNYGYRWGYKKHLQLQLYPLRSNVVHIYGMTEDFRQKIATDPYMTYSYSDHFDVGGNFTLYYTTDPAVKPEGSYFYLRWQTNYAGNLISLFDKYMESDGTSSLIFGIPYSQYVRTELSLVQTFRFGRDDQFSLAGRLLGGFGYAYGNSKSLPFEQLFYAGGANSLRGWQSRAVGPGSAPLDTTFKIRNQNGDMKLEANLEFRFPIYWKFEGAVFADAGNVWNLKKDDDEDAIDEKSLFDLSTTAFCWGVGLRLDFGLLLARLDMGLKTYDPVSAEWLGPAGWFSSGGYALHFGIGYPF